MIHRLPGRQKRFYDSLSADELRVERNQLARQQDVISLSVADAAERRRNELQRRIDYIDEKLQGERR